MGDHKTILVLGNGPSLKKFPFTSYKVPTIGMNVAYRYWEKINWYPTYYACLDDKVTDEHHAAIYHMFQRRKELGIKKFFLKRRIYNFHPELKRHPDILYSHEITSRSKGFSNYFRKTTGSWAVRWAINMGFSKILLLGIDCNYVPLYKKPGIVNHKQQLTQEIHSNPNYFFDDYQKKGDYMHIPSKGKEARDLHIETFKQIAKETRKGRVQVINCNKESKLYTMRILPYSPIEKELGLILFPVSLLSKPESVERELPINSSDKEEKNIPTQSIVTENLVSDQNKEMVKFPKSGEYVRSLNLPHVSSFPRTSDRLFLNKVQLATVQKLDELEDLEKKIQQQKRNPVGVTVNNGSVIFRNSANKSKKPKKKNKNSKIEEQVIRRRNIYDKKAKRGLGMASKPLRGRTIVLGGPKNRNNRLKRTFPSVAM